MNRPKDLKWSYMREKISSRNTQGCNNVEMKTLLMSNLSFQLIILQKLNNLQKIILINISIYKTL